MYKCIYELEYAQIFSLDKKGEDTVIFILTHHLGVTHEFHTQRLP